jgi:hypothetical protein
MCVILGINYVVIRKEYLRLIYNIIRQGPPYLENIQVYYNFKFYILFYNQILLYIY